MIRWSDGAVLALTKLKTRRIRTTITIVISGLLFACLVAALVISQGALNSINGFNKEGLNDRYIVQAVADPLLSGNMLQNLTIEASATQIYNQTVATKKTAAATLGVTYDPSDDTSPITTFTNPNGSGASFLNTAAPAAQQALQAWGTAHPGPGLTQLEQVAAPYHPTGFYSASLADLSDGTIATMQNGQENFASETQTTPSTANKDILQNDFNDDMVWVTADDLAKPFLLPGATTTNDPDAIPIIVPFSQAEEWLGLATLPKNATPTQKLDRIKQLYAKAGGITVTACYRNSVSEQQIASAITTEDAATQAKDNPDYQQPDLTYGLPSTTSCGAAPVTSDTRSYEEKTYDAHLDTFNEEFGTVVNPVQQKLVFRAIGAKRLDIVRIYSVYTLILSLYVAIFSLIVGILAAQAFDRHFWTATTVQAQLIFGASDGSRQFHFFAIKPWSIALILAAAVITGLLSMLFPLLRNIRRSPIKDMREE